MKILITGMSGFVGAALAAGLEARHRIIGTFHSGSVKPGKYKAARLDLGDGDDIGRLFVVEAPDLVVHCAAMSKVPQCESNKEAAEEINAGAAGLVAAAALRAGSRLIYLSTDLVFGGRKGMYREEDRPRPLSRYAETKLMGEGASRSRHAGTIVARLALCYGWGPRPEMSFTHWMIGELEQGRRVKVFTDQYRTPLYVGAMAGIVEKLVERGVDGETYHVGGQDRVSRHGFARRLCEVFGLDESLLVPVTMEEAGVATGNPFDCSLDTTRIRDLGCESPGVLQGLREMKACRMKGRGGTRPSKY